MVRLKLQSLPHPWWGVIKSQFTALNLSCKGLWVRLVHVWCVSWLETWTEFKYRFRVTPSLGDPSLSPGSAPSSDSSGQKHDKLSTGILVTHTICATMTCSLAKTDTRKLSSPKFQLPHLLLFTLQSPWVVAVCSLSRVYSCSFWKGWTVRSLLPCDTGCLFFFNTAYALPSEKLST